MHFKFFFFPLDIYKHYQPTNQSINQTPLTFSSSSPSQLLSLRILHCTIPHLSYERHPKPNPTSQPLTVLPLPYPYAISTFGTRVLSFIHSPIHPKTHKPTNKNAHHSPMNNNNNNNSGLFFLPSHFPHPPFSFFFSSFFFLLVDSTQPRAGEQKPEFCERECER